LLPPSFQEKLHLLDELSVGLRGDEIHARRVAALDLKLQAGPYPIGEFVLGAVAKVKIPLHEIGRLPGPKGGGVGPEIKGAVLFNPPGGEEAGKGMAHVELQRKIAFVIL